MSSARAEEATSSGTGFAVSKDGWIVTNAHVVDGCSYVTVASMGKASEIQTDKQNDLAVVRIAALPAKSQVLKLRGFPARLGEDVAALGYPLSQILSDGIKITMGNVNSLIGLDNDTRYLQVSTPIQPGNSGGPLVDRNGLVIGINSARLNDGFAIKNTGSIPQNVNFAIKSNILELFLQSRNIAYETETLKDQPPLGSADLASKVSPSVFQLMCFNDVTARKDGVEQISRSEPSAAAPESPSSLPSPDRNNGSMANVATDFVRLVVNSSMNDTVTALTVADKAYGSVVDFYGKTLSHEAVLQDKRDYFNRWPIRVSKIIDSSVRTDCQNMKCVVAGDYDWAVQSLRRNKQASGTASFFYVLDMQSGIKIIAEGGKARK
ncbi:S1C family serine protease [Brucella tritici]|uniref:S1C family serine protease n=1 Tax=Brucella tritici TaxID=94626 RepID=UPI00178C6EB8|nr:serine protease [Brucella tritici]